MKVKILVGQAAREYDGIAAIGISHLRQDLVLVPDGTVGKQKPIEIPPGEWDRIEVERAPE